MKLEMSSYLKSNKVLLKELLSRLLKDYNYVSILSTDTVGKNYRVSKNVTSVKSSFFGERGNVVRIYDKKGYFEYAFNEISKENLDQIVNDIHNAAELTTRFSSSNNIREHEITIEKEMKSSNCTEVKVDPRELGDEKILEVLINCKNKGLSKRKEIIDFLSMYNYLFINKIFISKNKDLEQSFMWSEAATIGVSAKDGNNKQAGNSYSGQCGAELLDKLEAGVDKTVQDAIDILTAKRVEPGTYDVICSPSITGLIAHEAFGHGVEMDMFVKDRAKAKDYIGKYVASPIVTMIDGAEAAVQTGSYFFDDEGNEASSTTIIENGVLKSGLNDILTAQELNVSSTGNGRRERYENKVYTRMTNTFIKPGDATLDEMMKTVKYGILLETYFSGMEDPKNWGIQCAINIGREIKDGKLTGKVFSPVMMTGYVPDLLKSISMVSKDFELEGAGYCGKGYKEFAKVSCGGPYLKCRARLG